MSIHKYLLTNSRIIYMDVYTSMHLCICTYTCVRVCAGVICVYYDVTYVYDDVTCVYDVGGV